MGDAPPCGWKLPSRSTIPEETLKFLKDAYLQLFSEILMTLCPSASGPRTLTAKEIKAFLVWAELGIPATDIPWLHAMDYGRFVRTMCATLSRHTS